MSDLELEEYFETETRIIAVLKNALAKGKPRKVEDFVNDMIHRGRTLRQILIVADNTRWKGQRQKIEEYYDARTS